MPPATLLARLRSAHGDHRAIAQGIVVGASFVFLSKLVGAAKEMAVAWRYGVSEIVDAYLYVFSLAHWPVDVWFAVLAVVLVPLAARIRENDPAELPRFRPQLLGLALLIGLVFLIVAEAGFPLFLRSPLSGLSAATAAHATKIAPALSFVILLGFPISVLSVWITAAGRFSNTLQESIPAATILLLVLLVPGNTAWPLVIGTLAGFGIHLLSLSISLARHKELEPPRFSLQSPHWRGFWRGFTIMLVGQVVVSLTLIIDQLFAARLGAGAIATLSYANRIVALIVGLGATAVSRAVLPVFSRAHAAGDVHLTRRVWQWSAVLFGAGAAAVIAGWFLGPWGVALLFERGAFTPADTARVTDVFRFGLFQLPFYFSAIVLVGAISARHDYTPIVFAGIVGTTVKLAGNAVLVPWLGLRGLPLANSFVYGSSLLFLAIALHRRTDRRPAQ